MKFTLSLTAVFILVLLIFSSPSDADILEIPQVESDVKTEPVGFINPPAEYIGEITNITLKI
jgi:hypothetical protein